MRKKENESSKNENAYKTTNEPRVGPHLLQSKDRLANFLTISNLGPLVMQDNERTLLMA